MILTKHVGWNLLIQQKSDQSDENLGREDRVVEADGLVSLRIICMLSEIFFVDLSLQNKSCLCENTLQIWFQDGKEAEELHEIQEQVDEIVADELVCLSAELLEKFTLISY